MAELLLACSCGECLELGLRFPDDPIQLQLIMGGLVDGEAAFPLLDAPTAATAGASDQTPQGRVLALAATIAGDVR